MIRSFQCKGDLNCGICNRLLTTLCKGWINDSDVDRHQHHVSHLQFADWRLHDPIRQRNFFGRHSGTARREITLLRRSAHRLSHQQLRQLFTVFRQRTEIPPRFSQHFLLRSAEEAGHADTFVWNSDDRSSKHVRDDDDPAVTQQSLATSLANAKIYNVVCRCICHCVLIFYLFILNLLFYLTCIL